MLNTDYYWTPRNSLTIDEFLKKRKPSLVTHADTDWIWAGNETKTIDPEAAALENKEEAKAIGAAQVVLNDLTKRLEKIENDASIPVRAKKGQKSKKVVREEAQAEAVASFKKIALESGYTCGKWILFPRHEDVDRIWGQVARSIAHGPLRDAGAHLAKVAPSEGSDENGPHLICIYFENVYDLDLVRKILIVLLTEHGIEPNSVKSDMYTVIGIDSKHPSKLRSTLWRPNEVIEGGGTEIKALKEKYSASKEVARNKAAAAATLSTDKENKAKKASPLSTDKPASVVSQASPNETKRKPQALLIPDDPPVKRIKTAAMLYKENDMFADSDDED